MNRTLVVFLCLVGGIAVLAFLAFVGVVALRSMSEEGIGDQVVLSRVVGRNFLLQPGLHRSLAGDGVATDGHDHLRRNTRRVGKGTNPEKFEGIAVGVS